MPISPFVLKDLKLGRVFVETGCYEGAGIAAALAAGFEKVISIELDRRSASRASALFAEKPVSVLHGDTVKLLPAVLETLTEPATFWLDAHPVGWSPVIGELNAMAISAIKNHTILIDDRRLMHGPQYPDGWITPSEEEVCRALMHINPAYKISFAHGHIPDDIIVAQIL
jgi:hypothetical protein